MGFPLRGRGRAFAGAKVPDGRCPIGSAGRIATGNPSIGCLFPFQRKITIPQKLGLTPILPHNNLRLSWLRIPPR